MSQWLEERAEELRASIAAIARMRDELAYLQTGWKPPDGGWSIGQVFEHLILTDTAYLPAMRKMIATGPRGDSSYKPTLAGKWLINSLQPTSTKKVTSPSIWRPGPEPRANVIDQYLKLREEMLQVVESAGDTDIRRNRMSSPASRFIRLTLGDVIVILIVHTERHMKQIERIRTHPGFPTST